MSYEEYMENRSKREVVQDVYISRIMDGMSIQELCQYMFDKLTEELDELSDEQLLEQVSEYYPDLLEEK
jgi:hypothetical protein